MKIFIKTFEVRDTQVALYKDMIINEQRNRFKYVVVAVTPYPHPDTQKIFHEQLHSATIECDDAGHQDRIFDEYTIDHAGKFVDKLQEQYKNIISRRNGMILPGDTNFKLPYKV